MAKTSKKSQRVAKPTGEAVLAATHGSTAVRPLEDVLNQIKRIACRGPQDGVIGFAIQWRTPKGSTLQMQWGQLKSKLP